MLLERCLSSKPKVNAYALIQHELSKAISSGEACIDFHDRQQAIEHAANTQTQGSI